jgi:hypothetical protein
LSYKTFKNRPAIKMKLSPLFNHQISIYFLQTAIISIFAKAKELKCYCLIDSSFQV